MSSIANALYVGGHQGVARSQDNGHKWQQITSLNDADAMGWAEAGNAIWVGGHPGLYRSTDGGQNFVKMTGDADIPDVHALGGANGMVYAASPQAGIVASTDSGRTWALRNANAGQSFMGTMLVDSANTSHVIAPDMSGPLVESRDGGRSWRAMGGPTGAMAAAWNPRNHRQIVSVGMQSSAISSDGGRSWKRLPLPDMASSVAFSGDGTTLFAASLAGDHAVVYQSEDGGRGWTTTQ